MDKRRSEGSSRERSRTNTTATNLKAPKRIANSDAFLDASRDPRLNNDKYRAQMMNNKSRVSPDTTITTMASKKVKVEKVDSADLNQCGLGLSQKVSVDKNACFACAMCPNRVFDTIEKVRGHVEDEHSINVAEIVNKLIKLPSTNNLRSFRCVACPASASSSIGTSEEELKVHFKEKHKINTVKPFLIKRICRICDYDKSSSNDELVKHITNEHPRSDFGDDDDEDDQDEANEEETNNDEYEPYEPEEELDYEPKPESPAPIPRDRSRDQRDYEASSIPEDGELSAEESRRRSRKRSRSVSSNSSQSSQESKIKVKPRKYRDSSSSSADSRIGRRKKASSVSPESSSKRKVYIKDSGGSKVVDRKKPQSPAHKAPTSSNSGTGGKEVFGLYYTPPGGFCEECNERYDKGEGAQRHYKSKAHFFNTKNKYRCYFCNAYVQDTKGHLESRHRDMTFQCQLNGCNHPRFTQAAKVIDHVRCNHSREFKRTNKDMDLFRKKMISMPRNIMSFTCKQCRIVFHGDVKIAIVHLVLEHGQNVPQRNDFVFQCRICGPRALFDNERQLESHCKMHLDEVSRGASRSPSSDRSSVDRGRSRSRSRSRSYSPRFQGGENGRPEGGRAGSGDRESGGNRGGARNILRCHFCTDEFRTLAVRKNHMLRDHRELLFECALCTFANMYRRDLVWHLREHHRKEHGFSDGQLVKEFVHMPKDLRKIICVKCSETEAHENAVWLAVDPNEITKDLKYHAQERHGVSGKAVDSIYRLMCMGCNEKFELEGEIKEWDDHMERQPCRQNRPREQSRSRSRSRTPYDDGFRGDRGAASGPPRRASSPVHIDLDQHCVFCSKAEMESKSIMENHVRQRHLEMAFICRLCETGNIHYEPDLPSIKDHLKEDHSKDDLDNEDVKDYTRYPRSLMCIKCNLCGLLCHGQKEDDLELHFKVYHEEVDFSTQHLDFLCRICMTSGQNDSQHELKEHLYNSHPDEMK